MRLGRQFCGRCNVKRTPMPIAGYSPSWDSEETRIFRRSVRTFVEREMVPAEARWAAQGRADREAWRMAGAAGLLLPDVPERYGGGGGTFAHEAVVVEELARGGVHIGIGVQSIVGHYILAYGSEEQRQRYLPRMARGDLIASIAMTEPNAGSDLQGTRTTARRDGTSYVVNGCKTFITNGPSAGLVCLAVRTDAKPGLRALSLLLVETDGLAGYRAGGSLEKIGRPAQEVCELFFDDARVPVANLLGTAEGRGLMQMMDQLPYERLSIALGAAATTERAVEITTRYAKERQAFGKPLIELQSVRFKLAEALTASHIGRVFADDCVARFISGQLDPTLAAMAKCALTETEFKVLDDCVQIHGGYGYMHEYPIARMWADSRIERIYAGSNELMKEVVGLSL